MRSAEEIVDIAAIRKTTHSGAQARMAEGLLLYNGELNVDLPELQSDERAVAANLYQLGVEQMAMRTSGVVPTVRFAIERPGEAEAKRARIKADIFLYDWWPRSAVMNGVMRQRARWFFAFGVAPVTVRPGPEGLPIWQERTPLGCYPAATAHVGDIVPPNVVFNYKRSGPDLYKAYPAQMWRICGGDLTALEAEFDVLEYMDDEQITCVVVGNDTNQFQKTGSPHEVLHTIENRANRPLAVIPKRITLDKPFGQFDGTIGAYQLQARLMSLYMIAQERAIFPETWIVSQPGFPRAEVLVSADPKEGIVGEILGGNIQKVDMSPSPITGNLIDRLEYIERSSGAIPAEFSGQSGSNIRTGRRGDSVMSAAVDHRLQEAQELFATSLEQENLIAIAVAKAYAGGKTFSVNVPNKGKTKYTPDEAFTEDTHTVSYAYAGADANSITIAVGQKLGLETLSRESAMELDPLVKDVEVEKDRIVGEGLERAFLSSIQTQAADPNGPYQPRDLARIVRLVKEDRMDLAAAVEKVDEELQQRQQEQAAGQAEGAGAQPGLAMPGAPGAPVPPDTVSDIGSSVGNLSQMLTQLRRPQMPIASEGRPIAQPVVA